jgi:mono/diheme cytochrome c family protein
LPKLKTFAATFLTVAITLSLSALAPGAPATASPDAEAQLRSRQALISWTTGTELDAHPSEPKPPFDNNLRLLGGAWYGQLCTPCHGPHGDGNGPRANQLSPRPRDFTKGVYEFRSTATAALPTDEDLWKVVSNGIHGTAMVPWITFSEYDRWALVAYVETFSPRFAHDARPPALEMTTPPPETPQLFAQGRRLYGDAGCVECHGVAGLGDGPSSPTLADATGLPIRPTDFSTGIFRRGSRRQDIFLTVRTGLDGTPMPSYADSLSTEQTWAIAAFIRSLIAGSQVSGNAEPSATAAAARLQERAGMMIDMPAMGRLPICRDIHPPRR